MLRYAAIAVPASPGCGECIAWRGMGQLWRPVHLLRTTAKTGRSEFGDLLAKVLRTGATTIRFQVTEAFLNASASELEAELVSDVAINSVPVGLPSFSAVRHDEAQPWQTGTCTRTKSLQSAGDDLTILRAWKAGQKLPV